MNMLNRHGLPSLAARNAAMIEAVTALPPIVVSDLFGVSASTTVAWANFRAGQLGRLPRRPRQHASLSVVRVVKAGGRPLRRTSGRRHRRHIRSSGKCCG